MIDATHLKAHRTSVSLLKKGLPPPYRADKRGLELQTPCRVQCSKQACSPASDRVGQVRDFSGADVLLADLPDEIEEVIWDRGYDSNQIRLSLAERTITACIPPRKNRKSKQSYNWNLYKKRHRIKNMFAKLKDWRRVSTSFIILSQGLSPEPSATV